jgi:hypothetical protein
MDYLVCQDHRPIHLTCRATWLVGALKRQRTVAQQRGPVVDTHASPRLVDRVLAYKPPKLAQRPPFGSCE